MRKIQNNKKIRNLVLALAARNIIKISDESFIKMKYKQIRGTELNLKQPQTFNEKIQYLKLHDRKEYYTNLVDKYEVRKFVKEKLGEEFLIPLLGVWEKFEQIDFSKLPNEFVLKCTHDSGGVVICKDKNTFNFKEAKKKIQKSLKTNYYYKGREWPYKNVKPRIIAEEYMIDESGTELKDYKIFNFNGIPKLIEVDYGRFTQHKRNLYDPEWNYMDLMIEYPNDETYRISKPENMEEMLKCARKLSEQFPFMRTDFYYIKGKIYFGEMTFYHGSGLELILPKSYNKILGDWINLEGIMEK